MSTKPSGLPGAKPSRGGPTPWDRARQCDTCGEDGRVLSDGSGIRIFCNTCKKQWPVSSSSLRPLAIPGPGRGLSKETVVEPDWSKAYDD
jgi:hypothetical protein